jgi:uncharacterized protein (DUF1800 family)
MTEKDKIEHLMRRAAFGTSIRNPAAASLEKQLEIVFNSNNEYQLLYLPDEEVITTRALMKMSKEERKEIIQDFAANIKKLNLEWIKLMGKTNGQLREKMSLFWHGHFAVRVRGFGQVESYINTIRKYALSNFGDLLMAVSKEPAMLRFLNNIQNKKGSPNENFAREVMELFTLGRGNYTENDIKEAARAFTGWGIDDEDNFQLKAHQHDPGEKTFFGKTGNWEGEDIIRMILERKETAVFICRKIYKYFVNPFADEARIQSLADSFYASKYDIKILMQEIFSSDWFYEEKNVGVQIKSPVELIVGLNRTFGISYDNADPLLALQRVLGQTLFFPPNVAGWAGGRNWIDNSTLITRLGLPEMLAKAGGMDFDVKNNMDDENPNESLRNKRKAKFNCHFNWTEFSAEYESKKDLELWSALSKRLLASSQIPAMPEYLRSTIIRAEGEQIQQMALYITRLPEYQLA